MTKHPTLHGHSLRLAIIFVILGMTQGCVNLLTPIGENKYDCNRRENPASPHCHSFKAVEASTSGPLPQSRFDQVVKISDQDRINGIAPDGANPASSADKQQGDSRTSMPRPAGKPVANDTPVRVGPVVQRTWIKRHADSNDMFIGDVLVYKEIVPTHWAGFRRPVGLGVAAPGGSAGVYPHRPSSGPPPAKTSAATPDAPNSGASVERNPFAQPGNASPGPGEMAPAPASPSGANTSLPQ